MRKLFFGLAAVLFVTTASAQEATTASAKPFIGLGAGLGVNLDFMNIVVPINVAPSLRLEPFVGFAYDRTHFDTNVAGATEVESTRDFILGVGGYLLRPVAPNVEMLLGARIGFDFGKDYVKVVSVGSDSTTTTSLLLAAVGGAEYYLSPNFALGVEASLNLTTHKDDADTRFTTVYTQGLATARVYFK
jgi:hypothetical protein